MPSFTSETMDNKYLEEQNPTSPENPSPIYVETSTARHQKACDNELFSYERLESTFRGGYDLKQTMLTSDEQKPRSTAPLP